MPDFGAVRRADEVEAARPLPVVLVAWAVSRSLDFPFRLAAILGAVILLLMANFWFALVWFAVFVVLAVVFREREGRRALRRRLQRGWQGSPEYAGAASDLGLVSRSGHAPPLKKARFTHTGRELEFALVPGVTASDFENATESLAAAFGAHRAAVSSPAPGAVTVRLVDSDSLAEAKSARWVDPNVSGGSATTAMGTPWWDAETTESEQS